MPWRFTPAEFLELWPQVGVARFPFPLQLRDSAATIDERDRTALHARAQLERDGILRSGRMEADLESALRTLARPLLWCTAFGFFGPQPHQLVRIRAARSGGSGVLAVQFAGPAEDVGGDLLVRTIAASALADEVVGALPPAPAGRSAPASWDRPAPSEGYASVDVMPSRTQRSAERFEQLVQGPFSCAGQFTAGHVDANGEQKRVSTLRWFDRPDDGRYLATHGQTATVRPADAATITTALHAQLRSLSRS